MRPDLHQRRHAIAEAFRSARRPSPEEQLRSRVLDIEREVAVLRDELRAATRPERIDLDAAGAYDPWLDDDADLLESPTVPTLESPGLMSAVASQALFGHS
jgi:hypothetical protein